MSDLEKLVRVLPRDQVAGDPEVAIDESIFGWPVPRDYLMIMRVYGPGVVDGFINLAAPGLGGGAVLDMGAQTRKERDALAKAAKLGLPQPYDPLSLIVWGITDNGDVCYWRVDSPDSSKWITVVRDGRGSEWWEFDGTSTKLLVGLIDKTIDCPIFPDDFPSGEVRFQHI